MVRRPYRNIGDNGCLVNQCGVRDRGDIKMTSENNSMEMINMLNDPSLLTEMVASCLNDDLSGKLLSINVRPNKLEYDTTISITMKLTTPAGYLVYSYDSFKLVEFDRNYNVPTLVERCLKLIDIMVNRIEK